MVKRKKPVSEASNLVVEIGALEQTYYISQDRGHAEPVGDEALIDIAGRIVGTAPTYKRYLNLPIEVSLARARSFAEKGWTPVSDSPFLLQLNLGKEGGSCMAYMPADAFWEIPRMIEGGRITHIEIRFRGLRYGHAEMLSLYFASEAKVALN